MRDYHCPKMYRSKPYGCGFGPVTATQAFLDLRSRCPRCGQLLRLVRKVRLMMEATGSCTVVSVAGTSYCGLPAVTAGPDGGRYCTRHEYLATVVGIGTPSPPPGAKATGKGRITREV